MESRFKQKRLAAVKSVRMLPQLIVKVTSDENLKFFLKCKGNVLRRAYKEIECIASGD